MSIVVCEGAETPQANGCVSQTTLQPVRVEISGDVFAPINGTEFALIAVVMYGSIALCRAAAELLNLFKLRSF